MEYLNFLIPNGFIRVATPFLLPIIFVLMYIGAINYIEFKKKPLIFFSSIFFILTVAIDLFFVKTIFRSDGNLFVGLLYIVLVYTVGFPLMEYYFYKRWINDDEKFDKINNPTINDSKLEYHPSPTKVILVGLISRYSMLTSAFILVIMCITAIVFDLDYNSAVIIYLALLFLLMSSVFVVSVSFLRIIVKCPECNLDIYKIDQNFNAYHDTAKHAVKDKIIECYSCHATYILDPNMDFEQAKVNAKKIAEIRKKRLQAIEDIQAGRK